MQVQGRDVLPLIDVSRWQGSIDWNRAARSINGAYIKATGGDGGLYVDGMFSQNAAGARFAGVPFGCYHFAGGGDVNAEVDKFCSTINGSGWTLPPVLDWEPRSYDPPTALRWVLAFCQAVEARTGVRPMIYTGAYVSLARDPQLADYPLWLAAYTPEPIPCPPWPTWTMWQHSSTGSVPGIAGNVDMNWADAAWLANCTGSAPVRGTSDPTPIPSTNVNGGDMLAILYFADKPDRWLLGIDRQGYYCWQIPGEQDLSVIQGRGVPVEQLGAGNDWLDATFHACTGL